MIISTVPLLQCKSCTCTLFSCPQLNSDPSLLNTSTFTGGRKPEPKVKLVHTVDKDWWLQTLKSLSAGLEGVAVSVAPNKFFWRGRGQNCRPLIESLTSHACFWTAVEEPGKPGENPAATGRTCRPSAICRVHQSVSQSVKHLLLTELLVSLSVSCNSVQGQRSTSCG